jgi:molybdate transport system substrate-binding protein
MNYQIKRAMKKHILQILLLACLLAACQGTAPARSSSPNSLTVFAAASLTEAFTDMGEAFKARNPGLEVVFNFAGSQQLAQQLAQGAPADVFASANQTQMDAAIQAGRLTMDDPQVFARNRLVVIYPKGNPGGLTRLGDLARPGIKLVLAAKEVPAGSYAMQFLEKASQSRHSRDQSADFGAGFKEAVLSNVVSYEENVRSVYSKLALGEADAGIVYATDVPRGNPDGVGRLEVPAALNAVAEYPIAVVRDSPNPSLAEAFVAFVLSPEGQQILAGYGFTPAD